MNAIINRIKLLTTFARNTRLSKLKTLRKKKDFVKAVIRYQSVGRNEKSPDHRDVVFVLTSAINTAYDPINYNVNHSPEERFSEVIRGIGSVHRHFPHARIFYLDNTQLSGEWIAHIRSVGAEFVDYSENYLMPRAKSENNKGVPWALTNLLFLAEYADQLVTKTVVFMNGRYEISAETELVVSSLRGHSGLVIRFSVINVHTIIFALTRFCSTKATRLFKITLILAILGYSVEDVFGLFYYPVSYIPEWFIHGKINGIYPIRL